MPVFDPDQVDPTVDPVDFNSQTAQITRQRKLADYLRQQASRTPQPQGQMVGNQYVAPHFLQQLLPAFNQAQAGWADRQAGGQEDAMAQAAGQARQKWATALPQATAAVAEKQGPPDESGSPELMGAPAVPVSTGQILKHALTGGEIPGNQGAAAAYLKGALSDQAREDTQAFKKEESAVTRLDKATLQADKLKSDYAIAKDRLDQQERQGVRDAETKRMHDETLRAMNAATNAQRAAAASLKNNQKPTPQAVLKDLTSLSEMSDAMDQVYSSYKPGFSGGMGALKSFGGKWVPGVDPSAANWWKDYENLAALKERHDKFGTALSAGEQKAWANATIQQGMTDATIQHNLKIRRDIMAKHYNEQLERQTKASAGQYPVSEVYQPKVLKAAEESVANPAAASPVMAAPPRALPKATGAKEPTYNPVTGRVE